MPASRQSVAGRASAAKPAPVKAAGDSPRGRRERENAAVATRILDAARVLFANEGVESVTMRKIAAAIGYTPAALYGHFKDKEALLQALCRHDFTALAAEQRKWARVADPVERIRRVGRSIVKFAADHPNHYRFMFMTPLAGVEPDDECLADLGNPDVDGYAFFVKLVQEAIDAGRLHPYLTDAHLVAQTFWAAVHGVIALHITHADDPWVHLRPLNTRARVMVDAMIEGLTRKGAAGGTDALAPAVSAGRGEESA